MSLKECPSKPPRECEVHRAKGTVFVLMSETRQRGVGWGALTLKTPSGTRVGLFYIIPSYLTG